MITRLEVRETYMETHVSDPTIADLREAMDEIERERNDWGTAEIEVIAGINQIVFRFPAGSSMLGRERGKACLTEENDRG